jgi:glycine/serine hydroxymethyltransferase
MKEPEMAKIANWIDKALTHKDDAQVLASIYAEVAETNQRFPLP